VVKVSLAGRGLLRVQALELRIAVKQRHIGIPDSSVTPGRRKSV
jgi:hypothetical protein